VLNDFFKENSIVSAGTTIGCKDGNDGTLSSAFHHSFVMPLLFDEWVAILPDGGFRSIL